MRMVVVLVLLIGGLSISPTVVKAVGEPTVSWSTVDNQTYAGVVTLSATAAATSSWISKWCLQKDGVAVTTDISYGGYVDYATFIASTGCWTQSNSGYAIISGSLRFDTTSWADGAHTYQITVTDSNNRTTTGSVLTINVANTGPSVTWSTVDNQTYAGVVTLSAVAAAATSGTSWISKWCLKKDGVAVTTDISYGGYVDYATFIASTGCWTQSNSGYAIISGSLRFDTTSWADGAHTYQITVTDSNNRTVTGSVLTINTFNPLPKLTVVGLTTGTTVVGTVSVETSVVFDVSQRNSIERKSTRICLDNQSQCVDDDSLNLATGRIKNGKYTLYVSTTDSIGRTVSAPPITFTTQNPGATISSVRRQAVKPTWKAKTTKVYISIDTSNATTYEVRYGLSAKSLNKRAGGTLEGSESDSESVSISGLKPKTKYFFQVTATGVNGSSSANVVSITTAKIPPKPRKIGTTCNWTRLYDSQGYSYYKYYDKYRWSDGTSTLGPTKSSYNFPC
jgi:hypothetical protein